MTGPVPGTTAPPRIVLRPDTPNSDLLDDVVIRDVTMFRAEMMSDTTAWMSCWLGDSDHRVTFHIRAVRRRGRPMRLELTVAETPPDGPGITYEEHP